MLSKKYVKNIILMLVLMFTFAFSINVHAEETVDNNDYSNEVVPGYEKTSRWSCTGSVSSVILEYKCASTTYCDVTGYQSLTTKIITYTYLQRLDGNSWTNVDSSSHTAYSWHAEYEDPMTTVSWGHDYRTRNVSMYIPGILMRTLFLQHEHHYIHGDTSNCVN